MTHPQPDALAVEVRLFRPRLAVRLAACAFAAGVLTTTLPAAAQDATAAADVMSAKQFTGLAVEDGVVVRAGPGVAELSVHALDKGDEVVVVNRRGDFLQILPPAGTFCLVPKARVNVRGEIDGSGQVGLVSDALNVRVGSTLNQAVGSTALRLAPGEEVRVVGEEGIYYKIEPPKLAFFYVPVSQLGKGREVRVGEGESGWVVADVPRPTPAEPPADPAGTPEPVELAEVEQEPAADVEETQDMVVAEAPLVTESPTPAVDAELPELPDLPDLPEVAPAPAAPSPLAAEFEAVDARYVAAAEQPLVEQPLEGLEAAYADLLADATAALESGDASAAAVLPVVEARLKTVRLRRQALDDLAAMKDMRRLLDDRQAALEAEREELAEMTERGRVSVYDAVGELQTSSLQVRGGASLFRLCDPATKRTMVYLRADGESAAALAGQLGRFVAVRGTAGRDEALDLRQISVAEFAVVDPDDVFGTVAAKLVPPSLIPTGAQASAPRQAAGE